ncbi:MAG TPA: hypothetical protein VGJ70_23740 [Solirubrobacteraceae bacterium]
MSPLPERRRSTLSIVDDGLLVVVAVVVALFAFKIIGLIVGTVWFLFKLAALVGLIFVALRVVRSRFR